ncbi:hypothetical protein CPC08DRAFT_764992 [Agrocybe pediades]|nr:hypothetical protein CPC08DRAFT_764992 [Agrocybe pediades]
MIRDQLARTNPLKLDIYIEKGERGPGEELFKLFLGSSSQWRTFYSIGFEGLSKALSRRGYSFPSLRTLTLKDCTGTFDFSRTENLETLAFGSYNRILEHENFFQWNQLKELTMHTGLTEGFISILQYLTKLQTLTLTLSSFSATRRGLSPAKPVPYLLPCPTQVVATERLHVSVENWAFQFLKHVNAPSLKRLYVDSVDSSWINSGTKRKSVVELVIRSAEFGPSIWSAVAKSFLSLHKLFILNPGTSRLCDQFIELLNPATPQDDCNLKNLTHIEYHGVISFSPDAMMAMLWNRLDYSKSHGFAVLKTFNIKYTNRRWAQDITVSDPNVWCRFYLEVAQLAAAGTKIPNYVQMSVEVAYV